MDLNYIYQRQQVSQFNADNAACDNSRRAHQNMADAYAALIATARNEAIVELRPWRLTFCWNAKGATKRRRR